MTRSLLRESEGLERDMTEKRIYPGQEHGPGWRRSDADYRPLIAAVVAQGIKDIRREDDSKPFREALTWLAYEGALWLEALDVDEGEELILKFLTNPDLRRLIYRRIGRFSTLGIPRTHKKKE